MIDARTAPYAALILRLSTGVLFVAHGLTKLLVFTPAGTAGFFQSLGLPGWLGVATMVVEIAGGLALIVGFHTRLISALLVPVIVGAALFVHVGNGFGWSNPGGGWEYPAMWAVAQVALVLLGDGAYALAPTRQLMPRTA